MKKAIIGRKVGMTQIFTEEGKVIPVTVIEAGPCTVIQKKMRAARGSFTLRNVSEQLRDLLDVTGLSGYLPIE